MKFIDDFIKISYANETELNYATAYGLEHSLRFQVDNVARYVHDNSGTSKEYHIERHIPNVAPLAPYMWFEYNGASVGCAPNEYFGCSLYIDYGRDEGIGMKKWESIDVPQERRWIVRAEHFAIKYCSDGQYDIAVSEWIYFI